MKRLFTALLAAVLCIGCTGCTSIFSSYREVEQLHLIQTIGVDKRGDEVTLSISSSQGGSVSATTMAHPGKSIPDAMRRLQELSVHEDIFYAHTRYAVVGEDTAVSGLPELLDFICRSGQIRTDIGMFVLKGGTAEELITRSSTADNSITDVLSSLDRAGRRDGSNYVFSCQEIIRALLEHGSALISAVQTKKTEGFIFSDAGELTAEPVGYGILKGEALCGYITGDSARGVNLLVNREGLGEVVVNAGAPVSLNARSSKCSITPSWDGDRLDAIRVECSLDCAVAEFSESVPHPSPEDYENAAQALSQEAEGWLRSVLELQRLYDADFLGLCAAVRSHSPKKYANIEENWPEALREVKYVVQVNAEIERDYDLRTPLK
ncbi:MAG: Ger(x)C family spore germination C-terminal domain-containing protein [Candidatus Heteroscillospira sp.]|jgi:spore germination protein KC